MLVMSMDLLWTKLCHITGVDTFEQYPELRTAL